MRAKTKRTWKWRRVCLVACLVAVFFVGGLFAFVQSPPGKRLLAREGSRILTHVTDLTWEIEGIEGFLPFRVGVNSLSISDASRPLVSVHDARVHVPLRALVRGAMHLSQVSAERVLLEGLPESDRKLSETIESLTRLPDLLVGIRLDAVRIQHLAIGEAIFGTAASFSIEGAWRSPSESDVLISHLTLVGYGRDTTRLDLRLEGDATHPLVAFHIEGEDTFFVPALLPWPEVDRVGIFVTDEAAGDAGAVVLSLNELPVLEGRLHIQNDDVPGLHGQGRFQLDHAVFPELYAAKGGPEVQWSLGLEWPSAGLVSVRTFELASEAGNAELSGSFELDTRQLDAHVRCTYFDISRIGHAPEALPTGPWNVVMSARGTVETFEGTLQVESGADISLAADWNLALSPLLAFESELHASLGSSVVPEGLAWLETVTASLSVNEDEDGVFHIPSLAASAGAASVEASGSLDPARHLAEARGDVRIVDIGIFAPFFPVTARGEITSTLEFHASGPEIRAELGAWSDRIDAGADGSLDAPQVAFELRGPSWWSEEPGDYTIVSNGRTGLAIETIYAGEVRYVLEGSVSAFSEVVVQEFEVTDDNVLLAARGEGSIEKKTGTAAVEVTVAELGALPFPVTHEFDGVMMLKADASASPERTTADIEFELAEVSGLPDAVSGFLGSRLEGVGTVAIAEREVLWQLTRAQAGPVSVEGDGAYALEDGAIRMQAGFTCSSLAGLGELAGQEIAGAFAGTLDLSFQEGVASLVLDAATEELAVGQWRPEAVRFAATAEGPVEALAGLASLELDANDVLLHARTDWAYRADAVAIEDATVQAGENRLELHARYDLAQGVFAGDMQAEFPEIAVFGRLTELPLDGSGTVTAAASIGGAPSELTLDARLHSIETPWLSIAQATALADLRGELTAPAGMLRVALTGSRVGPVRFAELSLDVEGTRDALAIDGVVQGGWEGILFDASMTGTLRDEATVFALDRLEGHVDETVFSLDSPAEVSRDDGDWAVRGFGLLLDGGTVELEGAYAPDVVVADLTWDRVPLRVARLAGAPRTIEGTSAGSVSLRGDPASPVLRAGVELEGVRVDGPAEEGAAASVLQCAVTVEEGYGHLEFSGDAGGVLNAHGHGRVPVRFSLVPFVAGLVEEGALEGLLEATGRLEALGLVVPLERHTLEGPLDAHLNVGGTVNRPQMSGEVRVTGARYENQITGTILDNMEVLVVGDGPSLTLTSFEAATLPQGRLSGTGACTLDPGAGFPFNLEVQFERARAVNRDDLWAEINGTVSGEGALEGGRIVGDVTVARGGLRVPKQLPVQVVTIPVKERNVPEDREQPQPRVQQLIPIELDITCRVPGRFNVRTEGLDSEWAGDLSVTGTASRPEIRGNLRVRRGELLFLDRRFDLRESTIALDGRYPPEPYFSLRAATRTHDLTAGIHLFGEMDTIELALESDPPLPDDQILARLLFDRDIRDLSPLQALQLARTAAALSDTAFGLSALPTGPALPFVDRLALDPGLNGVEIGVGLGKYLGERAYVEVHQGIGGESGKVSVEIEVTPNLSVESEVEADAQGALGFFWKRDY